MINPVIRCANLYLQIYNAIPVSVRNLVALVLALCAIFFLIHVIVRVIS